MKSIQAYETTDGRRFFEKDEAKTHEVFLQVEEQLYKDPSYFQGGLTGIDSAKELLEFLQRNDVMICRVMNWVPAPKEKNE